MVEIKQLQYFVVCAEMKSFSKAAEILYTTQPNVSKTISALEEELGFTVFVRKSRGIDLTAKGRHVYEYACKVVDNVQQMKSFAGMDRENELLIVTNPSSWMAASFSEFYNDHKEEDISYRIMTASTEDIIRRLSAGKDRLGFVYVMEPQMANYLYRLKKNNLEFHSLKQIESMIYLGACHPDADAASMGEIKDDQIRLIQCYEDEFSQERYMELLQKEEHVEKKMQISVITNSDYVMNEMLANTDLANISSAYLSHEEKALDHPGIALYEGKKMVHFGYMIRKDEEMDMWSKRFLEFIILRLEDGRNR